MAILLKYFTFAPLVCLVPYLIMTKNIFIHLLVIVLLLVATGLDSSAQRWKRQRYEASFILGATNFMGELGGANQIGTDYYKDFEIAMTRYCLGVGMRYKTTEFTALRGQLIYARLRGEDKLTQEPFRNNRNLMFRSPVIEFDITLEFSWMRESIASRYKVRRVKGRGQKGSEVYFYGFAGIGGMWFNPRGKLDGKYYSLRPLHTEGQGLVDSRPNYSPFQIVIPWGVGVRYKVNKQMSIGMEYGFRHTFTDYIDDVSQTYYDKATLANTYGKESSALSDPALSPAFIKTDGTVTPDHASPEGQGYGCQTCPNQQRGDPTDKDAYMFLNFSVNYRLKSSRKGLPKF